MPSGNPPAGTDVVAGDGSWFPGATAVFEIASFEDFVGYNAVIGCAQSTLVSELHDSSWGPLRRVARVITRDELPHRAASLRLLVNPTAIAKPQPTLSTSERAAAQQRLDNWFGAAMTWFNSCDPTFASTCVDLRLRTHDARTARTRFEQQLRELATTAELAVPAFITAQ
ncbi:MAG: hypothetical protein H7123_04235 [Thermoleophilia bacterium]|nr:hypothetical protein [Thermoleophilia bacterium]